LKHDNSKRSVRARRALTRPAPAGARRRRSTTASRTTS